MLFIQSDSDEGLSLVRMNQSFQFCLADPIVEPFQMELSFTFALFLWQLLMEKSISHPFLQEESYFVLNQI